MALVYGLDTGSWKLRLASMEGGFGRFTLRDVVEVAVATPDGESVPVQEAMSALRQAGTRREEGEWAAALPLDRGVVRLIRLPFTDKAAVARAVPAEVEAQVPYDLDDMVLVPRVIETKDGGSRTAVHMAPREDLKARIDLLKSAQVEPRSLCLDVAALATYAERGIQAILDIGHRRALLGVCQNGQLIGARLLPMGGLALTRALMEATGGEYATAEALKHTLAVASTPSAAEVSEWDSPDRTQPNAAVTVSGPGADPVAVLQDAVDAQIVLLRAELIALEDELGVGMDELLLCGGGAKLSGLVGLLSDRLGVGARPVVVPGGYPADCALAIALARVAAGENKAPDLRIEEFAFHGTADVLWNVFTYATVAAGIAFIVSAALFGVRYHDASSRLAELDDKVIAAVTGAYPDVPPERLTDGATALAIMQEKYASTQARIEKLGVTIAGIPPTLDTLKTLSDRVPDKSEARIDVRELTIADDSISFKAETDSYDSAAKIEAALQREPRFKSARKADEKKVGEALSFTLTIPLGESADADAGQEG